MLQPEEANAVDAARRGRSRARERLVTEYLPTVRAIALRYRAFGLPVDDLVQEGSLGLLEAIDRYEPGRSGDFESYARFRVRRAIRNALTDKSRVIRLPKQVRAGIPTVSLDRAVLDDGSTLEGLIADATAPDPEAETVAHDEEREVDEAVATLPARQREIVTRHFGLGRDPEQIADLAAELHVSQQRARAIERGALYTLRDRLDPPPDQ